MNFGIPNELGRDVIPSLESTVSGNYEVVYVPVSNTTTLDVSEEAIYKAISLHLRDLSASLQTLHERVNNRLRRIEALDIGASYQI